MKKILFLALLSLSASPLLAQLLEGEFPYYLNDDSCYVKIENEEFFVYSKAGQKLYNQGFDIYPVSISGDFFKAKKGNQVYVICPKTKFLFHLHPDYLKYKSYDDLQLAISSLSKDTLVKVAWGVFVDFNNVLYAPGEGIYPEKGRDKKYRLMDDVDRFFADPGALPEDSSQYDDYIRELFFIKAHRSNFLSSQVYDANYDESMDYFEGGESIKQGFALCDERYFIMRQNKKVGLVSSLGKNILPFEFDEIFYIQQEHLMQSELFPMICAKRNKMVEIYSATGKFIGKVEKMSYDSYFEPYGLINYSYYEGFVIGDYKKAGIMSTKGDLIVPPLYPHYDIIDFKIRDYVPIAKNMKDKAECGKYPFETYFLGFDQKARKYDFYAPNGQFLSTLIADEIVDYNRFGYLQYGINNQFGLLGPGACPLLPPSDNYIELFKGNRVIFLVSTDTTSYLVDEKMKPLFGTDYYAQFVDTTFAIVSKGGKSGLIDVNKSLSTFSWVIPNKYDDITFFYANYKQVFFKVKENEKYGLRGIYDEKEYEFLPVKYNSITQIGSCLVTQIGSHYGLMNFQWGDGDKAVILPHEYDMITEFSTYLLLIKKNGKTALYDYYNKRFVTGFDYDEIKKIPNEYQNFEVLRNGKSGIISSDGHVLIKTEYQKIRFDSISYEFECFKENKTVDCFFYDYSTKSLKK